MKSCLIATTVTGKYCATADLGVVAYYPNDAAPIESAEARTAKQAATWIDDHRNNQPLTSFVGKA